MAVSLVLVVVFAVALWKYMFYRPKNFPPGPPRIPLIGSYLFLSLINNQHLHKAAIWLGKFYQSNVIGLYLGSAPTVIALDQKSVRTVLSRPEFDGRPDNFLGRIRDPEHHLRGIFFTQNDFWKDQRRFFLRHTRDFGFGRRFTELEIALGDELQGFVEMIRGGPKFEHEQKFLTDQGLVCIPDVFFAVYANAFLRIVTGKSTPRKDRGALLNLGLQAMAFHKHSEVYGRLLAIIPNIRHVLPNWCGYNEILQSSRCLSTFASRVVDAELESYAAAAGEGRSFIQLYADEMQNAKEKLIEHPAYHRQQLIMTLVDFLFAAITTLPNQTAFLIQHLLLNPDCMHKIQTELDDVVGRGRLPTLDDRVNMPYTEACLREIMRLEAIAPNAIAHRAVKDTQLEGYDVNADTIVIATLYAFHLDEQFWGPDADKFRPERFLDENGKLSLKLDQSLPFGLGARLCAGETFARNAFFLVATALLQNFNISLSPSNQKIDLEKNKTGFIRYVPPTWVQVSER